MNKYLIMFAACAVALASCSTKSTQEAEEANAVETVSVTRPDVVVAPVATDGKVIELSDASLVAPGVKVEQLTVLDFNAVWCGPCRRLSPVLESLAAKYAGKVTFISIDVDKFGDLFEAYNVGSSIPAVVLLDADGGREVYVGTDDLLPAYKFESIIDARL